MQERVYEISILINRLNLLQEEGVEYITRAALIEALQEPRRLTTVGAELGIQSASCKCKVRHIYIEIEDNKCFKCGKPLS